MPILLPCSLILALALAPPETRGESAAGCAGLIAILAALGAWSRPAPALNRVLLASAALAWPMIVLSASPGKAIDALSVWALALAAGFGASRLHAPGNGDRWISGTLAVAGALAGLHGLFQRVWSLPRIAAELSQRHDIAYRQEILDRVLDGRAFGPFSTPAALGGFLALVLPVTAMLAWRARGRARILPLLAVLLEVAGMICTASATALIALALALALAGMIGLGSTGAGKWVLAAAVMMVVGGALVAELRGAEVLNPEHGNNPLRLRAGNIRIAGEMAADHPWIGVGPGGFGERYPAYRKADDNESRHVHNLPMELVAELGIPAGSALAIVFFILFLGPLARERIREAGGPGCRTALAVGLAAFAVHNLADYTAFMPSLMWLASLLLGLLSQAGTSGEKVERGGLDLAALAVVVLAAAIVAASGLAANARSAAMTAEAGGDAAGALARAGKAVTLAPWDPDARLLLCRLQLMEGKVPEAARHLDRTILLAPFRPAARSTRSMVRLQGGDLVGAWSDAREASRLYPADPAYREQAARLERMVQGRLPQ